ncbi:hypothetical protein Rcae01_06191 [Novipirellula caenicola]|uniref:Uncharacterized protein n=1 Tax=Novipirellula caenicola TaxID=1536901 RepID=A0ABP9W119_9BACT
MVDLRVRQWCIRRTRRSVVRLNQQVVKTFGSETTAFYSFTSTPLRCDAICGVVVWLSTAEAL